MQNVPPQMPGSYQPVAIASQGSYAGFWIRVLAYIFDAIILAIVGAVIGIPFSVNYSDLSSVTHSGSNIADLVAGLIYFAGTWTYLGGTVGQRILGLRVADATTGQPIPLGKAAVRFVGLVLSFIVCFIGVIWVAFDGRKQGWMDKIAGTVVLRR